MHEKGLKECIHYTFNSLVCFQIIPRNILKARKYSLKNQRNEVLIINKNVQSLFYIVLISIHTTHTHTHTAKNWKNRQNCFPNFFHEKPIPYDAQQWYIYICICVCLNHFKVVKCSHYTKKLNRFLYYRLSQYVIWWLS